MGAFAVGMMLARAPSSSAELITTTTTSTTRHDTITDQQLSDSTQYSITRLQARIVGQTPIYDQSFMAAFSSVSVQTAVSTARAQLQSVAPPNVYVVVGPRLVGATQQTVTAGNVVMTAFDGTQTSISTTGTIGPGTILIGENLSVDHFVPAGTFNLNTNTHTESFYRRLITSIDTTVITDLYVIEAVPIALTTPVIHTTYLTVGADQADHFLRNLFQRMDEDGSSTAGFALSPRIGQLAFAGRKLAFDGGLDLAEAPSGDMPFKRGTLGIWARGFGAWGDLDGHNGTLGYKTTTAGMAAGVDARIGENWLIGLAAGYSHSWITLQEEAGNGTATSVHLGAYARWQMGPWYAKGAFTWAHSWIDATRPLPMVSSTATGSTTGRQLGVRLEAGRRFDWDGIQIEPYAGLRFTNVHQRGFSETGSGIFDVTTESASRNALHTILGARASHQMALTERSTLLFEARAAWAQELLRENAAVTALVPGLSSQSFIVTGARPGPAAALLGLTMGLRYGPNFKAFVAYDAELRSRYNGHALTGGIRWTW